MDPMTSYRLNKAAFFTFAIVAGIAITFSACSGSDNTRKSAPAQTQHRETPSVMPKPAARTPDAVTLAQRLTNSGVACTDWEPIHQPTNGAVDMGACRAGNLVVSVYETSAEAMNALPYMQEMVGDIDDVDLIIGSNWAINCDISTTECEKIETVTGGVYFHLPKA